jgi:pyruvate/2-oxoglutarate dehydrogenase complex dihydrolipoamide acyltransferase (E2) component
VRVEVQMPNLGYDMTEGTVAVWRKELGDTVQRGEVLAEIETDKTTLEMESLASGTLAEIVAGAGTVVAVGATIAYLEVER